MRVVQALKGHVHAKHLELRVGMPHKVFEQIKPGK